MDDIRDIPVDYVSPIFTKVINTLSTSIAKQTENEVLNAVWRIGVDIDKDTLIAALSQDRQRYEEAYRSGYLAGYAKRDEEIVRCKDCKDRNNPINCQMESEGMHTPDDWFCADGKPREEGVENG